MPAEPEARGLGRPDAVVAVGRSSIELRQLQLPPAAEDDLPDLVRFQAMREFNEFDERWLLDFLSIDSSGDSPREGNLPRTVLATAIGPAASMPSRLRHRRPKNAAIATSPM